MYVEIAMCLPGDREEVVWDENASADWAMAMPLLEL